MSLDWSCKVSEKDIFPVRITRITSHLMKPDRVWCSHQTNKDSQNKDTPKFRGILSWLISQGFKGNFLCGIKSANITASIYEISTIFVFYMGENNG